LAKVAVYEYPRGGTKVTGPSIRLAEAVAQAWGNIDTGIIELERKDGESVAMAYAWDLETNYRQTKTFTVPHLRVTKHGSTVLTDPRDIYEMVANQGARRQRACILGVIPGDVIDRAEGECKSTLTRDQKPLSERINSMADTFQSEFGITKDMLEARIGMDIDAFTEQSFMSLARIYTSLHDGMSKVEDWFDTAIDAEEVKEAPKEKKSSGKKKASGQVDMSKLAPKNQQLTDEEKLEIERQEYEEAVEEAAAEAEEAEAK